MQPTTFYVVRHGETDHNAAKIRRGLYTDEPLNSQGWEQARSLARWFQSHLKEIVCNSCNDNPTRSKIKHRFPDTRSPVMIISSGKQRAFSTAYAIAQHTRCKEVFVNDSLREIVSGLQEEMSYEEAERLSQEWEAKQTSHSPNTPRCELTQFPGGEPNSKAICRMDAAMREIASKNQGKAVIVVTHASVFKLFAEAHVKTPPDQLEDRASLKLGNCDIAVLTFDGTFTLKKVVRHADM